MPLFKLRCPACGAINNDVYLTKAEDSEKEGCLSCGHKGLERVPSRSSFRLHNGKVGGFTNNSSKVTGG